MRLLCLHLFALFTVSACAKPNSLELGTIDGESSLSSGSKIALAPSMVSKERGLGDPGALVDEQALAGDPRDGVFGKPLVGWNTGGRSDVPAAAVIDLGADYDLSDIYLFDTNGNDSTRDNEWEVSVGAPGNWTLLVKEPCDKYQVWKRHQVQARTRYVRVANNVAYIGMAELVLYGTRADGSTTPPPPSGPVAVLASAPTETCLPSARFTVGGSGVVAYRYALDGGAYGSEVPVTATIELSRLSPGQHVLQVIGKNSAGTWQAQTTATSHTFGVREGGYFIFAVDAASAPSAGATVASKYITAIPQPSSVPATSYGNDRIDFYVRTQSGTLDYNFISLRVQAGGRTDVVAIRPYLPAGSGWQLVSIPRSAFTRIEPERFATVSTVGFAVYPGAGNGSFAVDELKFAGGTDEFLWMGDETPNAAQDGAFVSSNSTALRFVGTSASGGYACGTVETNHKMAPSDPALRAMYEAERTSVRGAIKPALAHPRLHGSDAEWLASFDAFAAMPCVPGKNGWGRLPDVRDSWDLFTYGARRCAGGVQTDLATHRDASFYFGAGGSWSRDRALRVLHLIRRTRACFARGGSDCIYTEAETSSLIEAFVDYEMTRFPDEVWHRTSPLYFDLGAEPAFRFWCLFLDTLWNEPALSSSDRAIVFAKLSERIDWFLEGYKIEHWSQWIGNNWTPILAVASMYWALTFYYEDPRAPRVLDKTLDILWGHRPYYLADGSYMEGSSTYISASLGSLFEINKLLRASFGALVKSPDWQRIGASYRWMLEHMAPDGRGVDFGDSWAGKGHGYLPLNALLYREALGEVAMGGSAFGPGAHDPCIVRQWAANVYYDNSLSMLWDVEETLARDWTSIGLTCNLDLAPGPRATVFSDGGVGTLHARAPGASALARAATNDNGGADQGTDDDRELFYQGDETFLAMSAIPNSYPHRELDVGAVLWSVFGSRLLWDLGYGQIADGATRYVTSEWSGTTEIFHLDNLPSGTNTLVVENAIRPNTTKYPGHTVYEDFTQLFGESATLDELEISAFPTLALDASAVYGGNRTGTANEAGWLRYFYRWAVALHDGRGATSGSDPLADGTPWNDGHVLLIDAFAVKSDRGTATVAEHFFTKRNDASACTSEVHDVRPTLVNASTLELVPRCAMMDDRSGALPEARGRILAASLGGGSFSVEPPFSFKNRTNGLETRQRMRYRPTAAQSQDVRVFLLLAERQNQTRQSASVTKVSCGTSSVCFDVKIGASTKRAKLDLYGSRYELVSFE